MKRLLFALVFLCAPAMAQNIDLVHTSIGKTPYTLAFVGNTPVLLPGGHFWGPAGPPVDFVSVTYVNTSGGLTTVYVDCKRLTSTKCATKFALRYKAIVKLLPIDAAATRKWRERQQGDK